MKMVGLQQLGTRFRTVGEEIGEQEDSPRTRTIQGPDGRLSQYEIRRPVHDPTQPRIPPAQNMVANESEIR